MDFPTSLSIQKLNIYKTERHNVDNTLNHKKSINLYYKKQFYSNYKIYEHILKTLSKMFSLLILPKN